jgi:16S rRNA (cytidine1402-2'-O)-methyltransferase
LVTDAGTPIVSDPGADLVSAWATEGGVVVPIPGASAVLAAVAGAGVTGPRWSFEGFLPRSGRDRRERLAAIAADDRGTVLFEAPGRVGATLRDLAEACGAERGGAVCRELTKVHETITRATLGELAASVADADGRRAAAHGDALAAARAEVERLVGSGTARGDAARQVAASTGIPRRQLYGAGERS